MQRSICLLVKALFILLAAACPDIGRAQLKDLKPDDYRLWSTLNSEKISDKGNWVSYALSYESGNDTLFVKHTTTGKTYAFPKGSEGGFGRETRFVCRDQNSTLHILELETGKRTTINEVLQYNIVADRLVCLRKMANTNELAILDFSGKLLKVIPDVTEYQWNPSGTVLACISGTDEKRVLEIINVSEGNTSKTVATGKNVIFSKPTWQQNGKALAFLKESHGDTSVMLYHIGSGKLYEANPKQLVGYPHDCQITATSFAPLTIAADGKRVFFGLTGNKPRKEETGVQVWNAADKVIYPLKRLMAGSSLPKIGVWWPESNRFQVLISDSLSYMMASGDGKYALTWNPDAYEPQNAQFGPIDLYVTDIEKGTTKLLLQKQSGDIKQLMVSPTGKYLSYFRETNWWVYEFATGAHRNLTKGITSFEESGYDWPGEIPADGNVGWTSGDKDLLLYDRYDIWKFSTNGKGAVRLTNGREKQTVCRVMEAPLQINFSGLKNGTVDLSKGLLLKTQGNGKTGYARWTESNGIQPIAVKEALVTQLQKAAHADTFAYLQQQYDAPPALMIKRAGYQQELLFQSNPQHFRFHWSHPKRITYKDSRGNPLTGMLIYPAGFDAAKKYPMVVNIYENQSASYHVYVNPKSQSSTGFNATDYAANGYFVFLPDIVYETGNPGLSAVDCVTAAVKAALTETAIDPSRIGLIGHSFGGYETNFIITRTGLFRAAVSGAGTSDLLSHYLHANAQSTKPLFWRFESGQFRMGASPFENPEAYRRNSPTHFASNVQTPLLQWTGDKDPQVEPNQAMEFHLALRRTKKPNILLQYPNEEHTIQKPENQSDLSQKIREWFGYYLKGNPLPDWMMSNI